MKVSIEEKRAEAIKRMKAFGFFHEAIELFEADGTPLSSEPPWGAFYALDDKQKAAVHEFEEEYGGLVYSVIRSFHQELGVIDNLLSRHKGRRTQHKGIFDHLPLVLVSMPSITIRRNSVSSAQSV